MKLLNEVIGADLPYDILDLVFAIGAQKFSEATPMETCEPTPHVAPEPVFCRLNFSSADNAALCF